MVVKGGVRGGNTFADLEANVVPVNRVDGGRWEDHFRRFRGKGVKGWKDKRDDRGEVKKSLSTRWSKQDSVYFCAASEWPSASGASLLQELAVQWRQQGFSASGTTNRPTVPLIPCLHLYNLMYYNNTRRGSNDLMLFVVIFHFFHFFVTPLFFTNLLDHHFRTSPRLSLLHAQKK